MTYSRAYGIIFRREETVAEDEMARELTALYEKHGDWYVAYVEEIPGVNTQGRTKEEARLNLRDALHMFIEANRDLGIPLPR
jgi:predicted RNase H-like HicB family nuclease